MSIYFEKGVQTNNTSCTRGSAYDIDLVLWHQITKRSNKKFYLTLLEHE